MSVVYHHEVKKAATPDVVTAKPGDGDGEVRHPCEYVSTGDMNAIAEGDWSASRQDVGAFKVCRFDDPGASLIPPSFAEVSIADPYHSWAEIAGGADSEPVAGLGDEAYVAGAGRTLWVRKGTVVIFVSVADMIVFDRDQGDVTVDPTADRAKAIALARLVLDKLPG